MRTIMVMYDTLCRRMLPPYGNDWVHAPNFERLAERTVAFDNCYGGSMPCIPARREMHTGRYNFLHRGWGPLEPFDDSVPQILKSHGVYTHLATDHHHYWQDGGATYHPRYSTHEFFRGQEGDEWKGQVADPETPDDLRHARGEVWRQDWVNRSYLTDVADHPQTRVFDAGLEFIRTNRAQDRWFLQIETFDPHEPYFTYDDFKKFYPHDYSGPHFDWPDYKQVTETPDELQHLRYEYAALLTMCDASLGRVLDMMDEYGMWDDTMLIVCTDHGFLLGEHNWLGKMVQPFWNETINTPLFVWDPRSGARNEHRQSLVQTIDFGPTLLEFFGVDRTEDMQGRPLREAVATDAAIRDAGLFGIFGGHVCITDGRYVYMRSCIDDTNQPLFEYTQMPCAMQSFFSVWSLSQATLAPPIGFTKNTPTLRIPGLSFMNPWRFGSLLYDLESDPLQQNPIIDDSVELRLATRMVELMKETDAPAEQYERLGLPADGPVTSEHLVVRTQWPQVESGSEPALTAADFPHAATQLSTPVNDLLDNPAVVEVLRTHAPQVVSPQITEVMGSMSLIDMAATPFLGLTRTQLKAIADELTPTA
ncbi:sulfatase [Nocardia sp. NPDC051030]|uniref:sulfatase n=1 Tax=Nocardia sp. NPDC051030 TaxID=3155162 RepID=UPI003420D921